MSPILIIGVIAAVLVVGIIIFFVFSRREEDLIDDRLNRIDDYDSFDDFLGGAPDEEEDSVSVLEESRRLLDPINEALSEREFGKNMRRKLARANLKLTVAEFAAAHVAAAAGIFVVFYLFVFPGQIVTSTALGLVGLILPQVYVSRLVNQRLKAFEEQLADTLGLWVNALRSGYSVLQSMEAISRDAPEPTKGEFERVIREVQIGIDLDDALEHLVERIDSEDLDLVVTAVNIQREVGGNLAEILEVIAHTIRERIKLKGEIRVLTSQGRITGYIISLLPLILLLAINALNPGYMTIFFENRTCGWPMLGVATALVGIGAAVIQRIVDVDI